VADQSAKKLKILHTESSLGWGGQELRVWSESVGLRCYGFDVRIACSSESKFHSRLPCSLIDGFLIQLPISRKSLRALVACMTLVRHYRPDIIVTHSSTDSWLFTLANHFRPKSVRAKLVRTRHVRAEIAPNILTKWLYSQCSHVITTSDDIKAHIISALAVSPMRVSCVPTGVDDSFLNSVAESTRSKSIQKTVSHPLRLLMVATLRSWKGHIYAIEALKKHHGSELTVVGDGPQESNLKLLVDELDLADRVAFVGYQKDVKKYFLDSDIVLLPSYANEGISQTQLQAMALGKIVIASNIGGLNEVIEHGHTGYLVEPKSTDALVVAIKEIEANWEEWSECGFRASSLVKAEYSQEKQVSTVSQIYLDIVSA